MIEPIDSDQLKQLLKACPDRLLDGFRFAVKTRWPSVTTTGWTFQNGNLVCPLLGGLFSAPTFRECTFRNVDFGGVVARGVGFGSCTFEACHFGGDEMAYLGKCTFDKCRFVQCVFSSVQFSKSNFRNCDFVAMKLEKVSFSAVDFLGLRMSGLAARVVFAGCSIHSSDLTGLIPSECRFTGKCALEEVQLPCGPKGVAVPASWLSDENAGRLCQKVSGIEVSTLLRDFEFLRMLGDPICISIKSFPSLTKQVGQLLVKEIWAERRERH